ncbi:unnamed protein product [Effrenium voratum]|uniref:EF-hand domain-containing protein n=1 Tax=Effrenium voratum TaxID=2562239 RepID=A0AA36MKF0_9DINO|nr:unnamed protein product [Effrenium voratum]
MDNQHVLSMDRGDEGPPISAHFSLPSEAVSDYAQTVKSAKSGKKPLGVAGQFIRASTRTHEENVHSFVGQVRSSVVAVVESAFVANTMAAIVLVDAFCTCVDVDFRAAKENTPEVYRILSNLCLILYTVELMFLLCLHGIKTLTDKFVAIDAIIIVSGWLELTVALLAIGDFHGAVLLRLLRLARIIRLVRLLRKTRGFKELQKLVTMGATCMKALAWSFLFCFIIMTIWSMLMVEFVYPCIEQMQQESGIFDDCEYCRKATSSVMHANLLLFKTVIAGDGWGHIAVPVLEAYPLTGFIFIGSLLTLVFGVLNLIVAVVVDTFAEFRARDVMKLAEEMDENFETDRKFLQKVFNRMDKEGKGELTLDELVEGARLDPEFQSRLRVMDIDELDLQQLFTMIDADGSGAIEPDEFIGPLSRWVHDSKTAPRFIKYNMMQSLNQQEELCRLSEYHFNVLANCMRELYASFGELKKEQQPVLTRPTSRKGTAQKAELGCNSATSFSRREMSTISLESAHYGVEQPNCSTLDTDEIEVKQISSISSDPDPKMLEQPQRSPFKDGEEGDALRSYSTPESRSEKGSEKEFQRADDIIRLALETLERSMRAATEDALRKAAEKVENALQGKPLSPVERKQETRAKRPSRFTGLPGFPVVEPFQFKHFGSANVSRAASFSRLSSQERINLPEDSTGFARKVSEGNAMPSEKPGISVLSDEMNSIWSYD